MPGEKDLTSRPHVEQVHTAGSVRSSDNGTSKEQADAEALATQHLIDNWVNDTPEERRLRRKLDWRILPCCWVLYLLGFLDRANVGYVFPSESQRQTRHI
jgi:hypothetical protein